MTTKELQERFEKANETAAKKNVLLGKYQMKYSKLRQGIIDKGYDPDGGRYQFEGTSKHDDCYWSFCDLEDVEERIEATIQAIQKANETAEKWRTKLEAQKEKDREWEKFPEALKEYENYLVNIWDEYDVNRKNRLYEEYKATSYKEFMKKYTYAAYRFVMETSIEDIHKENQRNANAAVFNLWQRVKDIVGDVVSYDLHMTNGNSMEGSAINGTVKGTNGTAEVHTIGAGGYNIQRYHFRVLVHKM